MSLISLPISERKTIYPNDFFSYSIGGKKMIPSNPLLEVGLRKSVAIKDLTNPEAWEDISFTSLVNNNFLASCQIEDSGGAQNLTLTMFDYNMSGLENKVVRAISLVNIAKASRGSVRQTGAANTQVSTSTGDQNVVDFFVGGVDDIHLRVRIGYGFDSKVLDKDTYSAPNTTNDEDFKNRTKEIKTSMRSPWLYFQILNTDFEPEMEGGMKITMRCISNGQSFLNKIRILQRFAVLKGKPLSVLAFLGSSINEVSEGKMRFAAPGSPGVFVSKSNSDNALTNIQTPTRLFTEQDKSFKTGDSWSDLPDVITEESRDSSENKEREISISLGGTPRMEAYQIDGDPVTHFRPIQSFKNLREIINEMCQQVPKRYVIELAGGRQVVKFASELLTGEDQVLPIKRVIPYTWSSYDYIDENETDDSKKLKTKIFFNYKDVETSIREQPHFRVYEYGNSPRSITLNCSVKSSSDFAMVNLALKTPDGIITSAAVQDEEGTGNTGSFIINNEIDTLTDWGDKPIFVTDVVDQDGGEKNLQGSSLKVLSEIVANVKNQPFKGSITLMGDPFYFFDDKIRPFEYSIFIDIKRPVVKSRRTDNNETSSTEVELYRSYLSGYYTISKITHTFGVDGFFTNLEIMKFPTAETNPTSSQIQQRAST